jgi:hypothetical protein
MERHIRMVTDAVMCKTAWPSTGASRSVVDAECTALPVLVVDRWLSTGCGPGGMVCQLVQHEGRGRGRGGACLGSRQAQVSQHGFGGRHAVPVIGPAGRIERADATQVSECSARSSFHNGGTRRTLDSGGWRRHQTDHGPPTAAASGGCPVTEVPAGPGNCGAGGSGQTLDDDQVRRRDLRAASSQ